MKVLVACEFSGTVRDAFIREGHDAISCDILSTESPGPHIQDDVLPYLRHKWDLVISHPPCTYLANSGVRWLVDKNNNWNISRYKLMEKSAAFFLECYNANAPRIAVENPVMHKHARRLINGMKQSFSIQPYEFGEPYSKRTCFWTKGLPILIADPSMSVRWQDAEGFDHNLYRTLRGNDLRIARSRSYVAVANAMARQWGRSCVLM